MLFPGKRAAPIVAVLDGHPHTLSFLGTINSSAMACLGVNDFGMGFVATLDDAGNGTETLYVAPDTADGAALHRVLGPGQEAT